MKSSAVVKLFNSIIKLKEETNYQSLAEQSGIENYTKELTKLVKIFIEESVAEVTYATLGYLSGDIVTKPQISYSEDNDLSIQFNNTIYDLAIKREIASLTEIIIKHYRKSILIYSESDNNKDMDVINEYIGYSFNIKSIDDIQASSQIEINTKSINEVKKIVRGLIESKSMLNPAQNNSIYIVDFYKKIKGEEAFNFEDFFSLIYYYYLFYKKNKNSPYVYIIKPINSHQEFNALLILCVNKILTRDILAILNMVVTDSISEIAARKLSIWVITGCISAIMSRNLSHNVGSHVIPNIENYNAEDIKQFKSYVSLFNKYIQERMELIAEINSLITQPIFLEENLGTVVDDFVKNKFVFEGLIDGDQHPTGTPQKVVIGNSDRQPNDESFEIRLDGTTLNGRKNVLFPGGRSGAQAFYVILENIIRNAKKHDFPVQNSGEYQFCFKIEMEDFTDPVIAFAGRYYKVRISNFSRGKRSTLEQEEKIKTIRKHVYDDILKEGQLREQGWGMLEMKIAAGYLINYPIEFINEANQEAADRGYVRLVDHLGNTTYYPPLLKVYYDHGGHLVHEFHLLKPQFCSVEPTLSQIPEFPSEGIQRDGKDFRYKYHLVDSGSTEETDHQRRIVATADEILALVRKGNASDFKKTIGDLWLKQYVKGRIEILPQIVKAEENENKILSGETKNSKVGEQNSTLTALFDDHGVKQIKDKISFEVLKNKYFYYEYMDSKTPMYAEIGKLPPNEIYEAILTRISIFDERIQRKNGDTLFSLSPLSVREHACLKHIYLPPIELNVPEQVCGEGELPINLNEHSTGDSAFNDRLKEAISARIGIDDFIVVHFSLLGGAKTQSGNMYETLIKKISGTRSKLILTSGKGRPSDLPPSCYYVNYTTIERFLLTKPSKIHLTNILFASRKSRKK